MSIRLVAPLFLLILPLIHGEVFQGKVRGKQDDGCPRHLRLCNDQCLERTTNHTVPCDTGPWGKCLSANLPFYCNITNTCIGKDQICGDHCFDGNPDSFWFDHTSNDKTGKWNRKINLWQLEKGAYDEKTFVWGVNNTKWFERYNCNGKCVTYSEPCNGGCNHPEQVKKHLQKCGAKCREKDSMKGFHDCGDECLPQDVPCNGTCPHSTLWMTGPQWLCGNECRPKDQKSIGFQRWKVCPDGTCRDKSINCDGPLPGNCPPGKILCRYHSWIRGRDFDCKSSSDYYVCNETRENNGWATFLGAQKHPDKWCFIKSDPCQGECLPGYLKCERENDGPYCADATEHIKCGDGCKKSRDYHTCNQTCISTEKMCNGVCALGFEKCGDRCIERSESSFVDCDGICQHPKKLCNGKCSKPGWFKSLVTDLSDHYNYNKVICKPNSERNEYHECNGIFLDHKIACNGTCSSESASLCRGGKCLTKWDRWNCDDECIDKMEHCNGVCEVKQKIPCGNLCKYDFEMKTYRTCGDECIYQDKLCDGACPEGRVACGDECIAEEQIKWNRPCGGVCLSKRLPCEGQCSEDMPFKCMGHNGNIVDHKGEMCIESKRCGDGRNDCQDGFDEICFQQWSCNGKLQCINKPCPQHDQDKDSDQTMCQSHVNKTDIWGRIKRYDMYYCAAEDECKLEGVPCNGVCMVDMNSEYFRPYNRPQFACKDGRKCIKPYKVIDGRKDCNDGSDEICRCKGNINCQERLSVNGSSVNDIYLQCESKDEYIKLRKYCDGKEDCKDGSDERCGDCPGIIKCKNGDLVCANVPCNNTGLNDDKPDNYLAGLDNFTCEAKGWDLCQAVSGEPKCVRRAIEANKWNNKQARDGELCNGECFAGVPCGDKCIPKFDNGYGNQWSPSCNGLCNHINSSSPLVQCDEYCLTEELIKESNQNRHVKYQETLLCEGECRTHSSKLQRIEASRRACNGTCLYGDNNDFQQWFPCDTGDQCFSEGEWCNGVKDCQDGTDEASCSQCPRIKRCKLGSWKHPIVNQTSSNGPRFPDFVCNNEPCGKCSSPGTFPCGNQCISTDQVCLFSGLCSSPDQFKCDKCLDAAAICDGREDCQDGSDENNCVEYKGSWMCNGVFQTKTKPCL